MISVYTCVKCYPFKEGIAGLGYLIRYSDGSTFSNSFYNVGVSKDYVELLVVFNVLKELIESNKKLEPVIVYIENEYHRALLSTHIYSEVYIKNSIYKKRNSEIIMKIYDLLFKKVRFQIKWYPLLKNNAFTNVAEDLARKSRLEAVVCLGKNGNSILRV